MPRPGVHAGDLRDRGHAIRNNLEHDGAAMAMPEPLDARAADLPPGRETVLLSAPGAGTDYDVA